MYLLDTDISSYYLRGRYNLISIFEAKGFEKIHISRITVAELEVLARRNPHSVINLSAIGNLSLRVGVLEIDIPTWQSFSIMKAALLNRGQPRGDFDILIAAVARQHDMIVVTNNRSHYEGLAATENWLEEVES